MIKRLKVKFVLLAMVCLTLLLTMIVAGMNIINYNSVVRDADEILEFLSENKGRFADFDMKKDKMPPHMSQETPYETRYFSVLLNNSGEVVQTETSRIAAVDRATAIDYAQQAFQDTDSGGFIAALRYMKYEEGNNIRITFLNCGKELQSFRSFFWISVGMSLCGLFIIFWVIFFS